MSDSTLSNKDMLDSEDSFGVAYETHMNSIYRFLYWRTKNKQISEDLTSQTFEKAWSNRDKFKGGSAQAWFYRIARNVLIDYWRKTKEVAVDNIELVEEPSLLSNEELLDKKIQIQNTKKALKKLPDDMRLIIILRFIEGYSSRQTAEILDISEGNVRVIQYRALRKLRGLLE